MDLHAVASYNHTTSILAFDEDTEQWSEFSQGYMGAADRFQTIYSRPLHLRTFSLPVDVVIPDSRTIKEEGSEEIYILGQTRDDVKDGNRYQMLVAGRLCTGAAGGVAEIHRKVTQGTVPDLGPLVDTVVGNHYCDMEMFSAKSDPETDNDTTLIHYVILSQTVDLEEDDFVHLKGKTYRVQAVYPDSGFTFGRVEQTEDERVDVTYKVNTVSHTPGSGNKPSKGGGNYVITGYIRDYTVTDGGNGKNKIEFCFHVKSKHIGFTPDEHGKINYQGRDADIYEYSFDSKEKEWRFKCRV